MNGAQSYCAVLFYFTHTGHTVRAITIARTSAASAGAAAAAYVAVDVAVEFMQRIMLSVQSCRGFRLIL